MLLDLGILTKTAPKHVVKDDGTRLHYSDGNGSIRQVSLRIAALCDECRPRSGRKMDEMPCESLVSLSEGRVATEENLLGPRVAE